MDAVGLRDVVSEGPLVTDGGMGTALIERGAPVGECVEAMNIRSPATVEAVHRSFVEAGARLVLTDRKSVV